MNQQSRLEKDIPDSILKLKKELKGDLNGAPRTVFDLVPVLGWISVGWLPGPEDFNPPQPDFSGKHCAHAWSVWSSEEYEGYSVRIDGQEMNVIGERCNHDQYTVFFDSADEAIKVAHYLCERLQVLKKLPINIGDL